MFVYRSFPYYFLVSLFLVSFLLVLNSFYHFPIFQFSNETTSSKESEVFLKNPSNQTLVELVDNSVLKLDNPFFLANKESGGNNTSSNNKDLNSIIQQEGTPLAEEKKSKEDLKSPKDQLDIQEIIGDSITPQAKSKKEGASSQQGNATQTLSIYMDDQGNLSVNSVAFKEAEYLIKIAKELFQYWVDFIPGAMIYYGYVKKNEEGFVEGSIRFDKKKNRYQMSIEKPFESRIMNNNTQNAFKFYHVPVNHKINLVSIRVALRIHKDSLKVSGQFEFNIK